MAIVDLAFVVAQEVHAVDLAEVLMAAADVVEDVTLFDVYRGDTLPRGHALTRLQRALLLDGQDPE